LIYLFIYAFFYDIYERYYTFRKDSRIEKKETKLFLTEYSIIILYYKLVIISHFAASIGQARLLARISLNFLTLLLHYRRALSR